MHGVLAFFQRTAVGGLLFILPLAIVVFLAGQFMVILRPAATDVVRLAGWAPLSPLFLAIASLVAVVTFAFLAGLIATTMAGQKLTERLENIVLNRMPGYFMIKNAASNAARSMAAIEQPGRQNAVLVFNGHSWLIGFVTGDVEPELLAVFVPNAPSTEFGSLLYVHKDRVIESGLSASEALGCIRRLGARTPRLPLQAFPVGASS